MLVMRWLALVQSITGSRFEFSCNQLVQFQNDSICEKVFPKYKEIFQRPKGYPDGDIFYAKYILVVKFSKI